MWLYWEALEGVKWQHPRATSCTGQGLHQLPLGSGTPFYSTKLMGQGGASRQRAPCAMLTPPLCLPQNLSLIVVGLGAVFSLIFHLGTKEKPYPLGSLPQPESTPLLQKEPTRCPRPLLAWKDWLLEPAFYQVGAGRATAMPRPPPPAGAG